MSDLIDNFDQWWGDEPDLHDGQKDSALDAWNYQEKRIKELEAQLNQLKTEKAYFSFDPLGDVLSEHSTMEEAVEHANKSISYCLDDCWDESVEQICVGVITHKAQQTNRVNRPLDLDEEGCDGEGEYWDPDHTYKCDYELKPFLSEE